MIITRFAPSPTGHLHLGNMRSCFLNWAYSKKNNGKFILRYDDTDQERSKDEYVKSIASDLDWLKIKYDETFYQSKRIERYNELFDQLISLKFVYPCFESSEDLDTKKKLQLKAGKPPIYDRSSLNLSKEEIEKKIINGNQPYWRFKLSQNKIKWNDLVKGETEVDLASQSDPVLRRADGSYLYHFPSVVDDIDMKISHIIRGEDHLTNSAIHLELFKCLNSDLPSLGHNPLMLNEDGTKLSKRNLDSISLKQFRKSGYTVNSILSYLYSLGLNSDYDFETILENNFKDFNLEDISKNLPKIDIDKIAFFQKNSLRSMNLKGLNNEFPELEELALTKAGWELIKENVEKYEDIRNLWNIINRREIKTKPSDDFIKLLIKNLNGISNFSFDEYVNYLMTIDKSLSKKEIFTNTRYLLTGNQNGPSVKDLYNYFGFEGLKKILNEY
tara:strand:+ start:104 stop:1435 length:1332 start_codon:yes stop_codon:yes gene_type:complete